jgi:hypothetical protein
MINKDVSNSQANQVGRKYPEELEDQGQCH